MLEEGKNPFLMKRGTNSDDEQLLTERKQKQEGGAQDPYSYSDSKQNSKLTLRKFIYS